MPSTTALAARGNWPSIFADLAPQLDEFAGHSKHGACPSHGGKDGFRLFADDSGGGVCNTCGTFSDGFRVLEWLNGWSFIESCAHIDKLLGCGKKGFRATEPTDSDSRFFKYVQSKMIALSGSCAASLYLKSRKIYFKALSHSDIGFIRRVGHFDGGKYIASYAVLVAAMRDSKGKLITYQITYLNDQGVKIGGAAKKIVSKLGGQSVGIYPFGFERMIKVGKIGVCEGLEDCLSASAIYKLPVIGVTGTSLVAKFDVPGGVGKLLALIQNDKGYQSHSAAFAMLKRCVSLDHKLVTAWRVSRLGDFNDDLLANVGEL